MRYDPFDASILEDPYPTYRVLRDAAPVYRAQDSHTWVLSRHADGQAAALDHGTYASVASLSPPHPSSRGGLPPPPRGVGISWVLFCRLCRLCPRPDTTSCAPW